jgi:hypothetical protein
LVGAVAGAGSSTKQMRLVMVMFQGMSCHHYDKFFASTR